MSIVVTGATGHLGRLIVESLLSRGVPAADIVAVGRNVDKIAGLGVTVRQADYNDVESLKKAFAGADKLMLVSGSEVGKRAAQHANVITAAQDAGVSLIAYTSAPKADDTTLGLAVEHRATEIALADSGLPAVILRNGWYVENYTPQIPTYLEHGITGSAGDGKIAAATRADLAEAAAVVLTTDGHAGRVYELGGEPFTMPELAALISRETGRTVHYTDLPEQDYATVLVGAGLPQVYANLLADSDRAASEGALDIPRTDLETLLGRPVTPLADAIRAAL